MAIMSPVTGVSATPKMSLAEAVAATGLTDMDAFAFMASIKGQELAEAGLLDEDEAGSIALYTMQSPLFSAVNAMLRDRDRQALKPFFPYLRLVLEAQRKLKPFSGVVWRGVRGQDLRGRYPKGKNFFWWAFSSCTLELSVLNNDMFLGTAGVRTVFNIQCTSGLDISHFSDFPEAEVLLLPGSRFEVVDSMDMGHGLAMVHIRELPVPVQLFA